MIESERYDPSADEADQVRTRVEAALSSVKSRLRGHGGNVVVGDIKDGVVDLEFQGACRGCPAQGFTFVSVVEPAVRSVSAVTTVKSSRSHISPFVVERIRKMSPALTAHARSLQHSIDHDCDA